MIIISASLKENDININVFCLSSKFIDISKTTQYTNNLI